MKPIMPAPSPGYNKKDTRKSSMYNDILELASRNLSQFKPKSFDCQLSQLSGNQIKSRQSHMGTIGNINQLRHKFQTKDAGGGMLSSLNNAIFKAKGSSDRKRNSNSKRKTKDLPKEIVKEIKPLRRPSVIQDKKTGIKALMVRNQNANTVQIERGL